MASRHPIPVMKESDIGADERKIIPRFPDPVVVEFSKGKALGEFVEQISANKSTKIVAAAGAGKSVKMPTELFRAIGGTLVHCVPSRLLAVSLHDYVKTLNQPDVPIALCTEVVDEFPTSGLVFTSSATFLGQVCRWRSMDVDPGVLLYMDECHESDASTAVIRNLKHELHGVNRYAESSATPGTGDAQTAFAQARLPSTVNEYKTSMPPPEKWDMTANGVPWSLKKLGGDIIVFTDDDDHAKTVMRNFIMAGLRAFRLTGHTSVSEYRNVMSNLNTKGQGVVTVLVLDYTFRSGFSFPTVERIIDLSSVKFYVNRNGKTETEYRELYNAEVYQTKNRGGRIAGRDCAYFRLQFTPQNILVYLEGAEALIASLWYRMLGFCPEGMLKGTKTYSGLVPKNMLVAMTGRYVLSCYSFDKQWPGKVVERAVSPPAEPLVLDSPPADKVNFDLDLLRSPVVDSSYSGVSNGRPPSIFSLGDDDEADGVISEEAFVKAHRKSVRAKPPSVPEKDKLMPPVPPLEQHDPTFAAIRGINQMRDTMTVSKTDMAIGKYYRLYGFDGNITTEYFPDGIIGLANAAHERSLGNFVRSLSAGVALEARQRAVLDCNRATTKYRAISNVMARIAENRDKIKGLDEQALRNWFEMTRDLLLNADVTIRQCFKVLETAGSGEVATVRQSAFKDAELEYIQVLTNVLRACVIPTQSMNTYKALEHYDEVDHESMNEVLVHAEKYKYLGGRINMRISGRSLRERFANMILNGKPVEVDAIMS